jgi:hypothetical protein
MQRPNVDVKTDMNSLPFETKQKRGAPCIHQGNMPGRGCFACIERASLYCNARAKPACFLLPACLLHTIFFPSLFSPLSLALFHTHLRPYLHVKRSGEEEELTYHRPEIDSQPLCHGVMPFSPPVRATRSRTYVVCVVEAEQRIVQCGQALHRQVWGSRPLQRQDPRSRRRSGKGRKV